MLAVEGHISLYYFNLSTNSFLNMKIYYIPNDLILNLINSKQNYGKKYGWIYLPCFDTLSNKPYDIPHGDTWTAKNLVGTYHLHVFNIYTVGFDTQCLAVELQMLKC